MGLTSGELLEISTSFLKYYFCLFRKCSSFTQSKTGLLNNLTIYVASMKALPETHKFLGLIKSVYSLQYIIGHELTSNVTSVLRGKKIKP